MKQPWGVGERLADSPELLGHSLLSVSRPMPTQEQALGGNCLYLTAER